MKKATITIALSFLFIFSSFSQENLIKKYPLKDYVAPEIKYQLMNLGTGLNLNGSRGTAEDINANIFNTNLDLNYYLYQNTSAFQGISDVRSNTNYQYENFKRTDEDDSLKLKINSVRLKLNYYGQNRFYFDNSVFVGLNGYINFYVSPRKETSLHQYSNYQRYTFDITPYLSVGKGRIQQVQSAREAMDILLALQKSNRLSLNPDNALIDSIAKVANSIRYKRFYDIRFKTIYQLEELDKALQNMHLVDTADIIYFANLNDIWNFTQNFKRGSGIRYEGGIVPLYSLSYYKLDRSNQTDQNDLVVHDYKWYGLFGFFSFNRMLPISYAWQSDIMLDITFGYASEDRRHNYLNNETIHITTNNLKAMFNASWQFGFYPNTRTYMGITPYTAVSYKSETDFSNIEFGLNSGFIFNAYYYVSPRLRLSAGANFFYVDSFDNSVPSPFWNNATYAQNDLIALQYTNDVITNPVDAYTSQRERFMYTFNFSLQYAIF